MGKRTITKGNFGQCPRCGKDVHIVSTPHIMGVTTNNWHECPDHGSCDPITLTAFQKLQLELLEGLREEMKR